VVFGLTEAILFFGEAEPSASPDAQGLSRKSRTGYELIAQL